MEAPAPGGPAIATVTPILPKPNQSIAITGSRFGNQPPYNGNSSYIRISDLMENWNAGNTVDLVTLDVARWTDNEITIQAFTGPYGDGWSLNNGDLLRIQVWNPQTGAGPAATGVTVLSGSVEPLPTRNEGAAPNVAGTWQGSYSTLSGPLASCPGPVAFDIEIQQDGILVTGTVKDHIPTLADLVSDIDGSVEGLREYSLCSVWERLFSDVLQQSQGHCILSRLQVVNSGTLGPAKPSSPAGMGTHG
jgi:hypothetical protein